MSQLYLVIDSFLALLVILISLTTIGFTIYWLYDFIYKPGGLIYNVDLISLRFTSWMRCGLMTVITGILKGILSVINFFINLTDNMIPNIDDLPDITKILDILNFNLPNFLDLLPNGLFDLDIS